MTPSVFGCPGPKLAVAESRFGRKSPSSLVKTALVDKDESQIEHVCDRYRSSWAASLGVPREAFAKEPFRAVEMAVFAQEVPQIVKCDQRVRVFGPFARRSVSAIV